MKPPASVFIDALNLIKRASQNMKDNGANVDALEVIDDLIDQLSQAADELPALIHQCENYQCLVCEHFIEEIAAAGEMSINWFECTQPDLYNCPTVKACGFTKQDDDELAIPNFLKPQAH